jgi:hypothetical protein
MGGRINELDLGRRIGWVSGGIHDHLFVGRRRIWITAAIVTLCTWQVGFAVPTIGLDASWMGGLYMAIHSGKDFGSEIVFTYGPLGFLDWPGLWYGGLAVLAFVFSAAIFFAFTVTLITALERSVGLAAAAVVGFLFLATIPDLEQAPLILGVGLCFFALREDRPDWGLPLLAIGGGALCAFEILIKLSGGPEILIAVLLAMVGARANGKWWGIFGACFVGGTLVLWLIAGQAIGSLWHYAIYGLQIVSGYNEAMSIGGAPTWEAVLLIFVAGGLVVATAFAPWRDGRARLFAVLLVAVAAFSSYKYGIVRFEPYHLSLGIGALLGIWLQLPWPRIRAMAFLGASVILGILIFHTYATPTRLDAINNLRLFRTNVELAARPGLRQQKENESRATLVAAYALDPETLAAMKGRRVQVEPWEDAIAWAYELDWSPWPTFQNYVAYTAKLDELNAEAIEDPDGPQVILRINPGGPLPWGASSIEGRLPAWDPPQQSLAIVCNFVPTLTKPTTQILSRIPDRCGEPEPVGTASAQPGEPVEVPQAGPDEIIVMRLSGMEIEGLEKLKSLLWKPPIRTAILNEGQVTYRLVPGTTSNDMVVSRSPSLTGKGGFEQLPEVKQIAIEGVSRTIGFKFYRVKVAPAQRPTG